jgi:hypothetical protein
LEPALPVLERLIDKLLVVVRSKVSRVTLEALHYELALFGIEELGGRWILKHGSATVARRDRTRLTSYMYQDAIKATTIVTKPSMRN